MTQPIWSDMQKRAVAQSTARINLAHGPVRSGKTVALEVLRWFEYVNEAPKGDLLMAGKTMKSLERNVLRPLKDWWGGAVDYSLGKKEAQICGRRVELEGANDERAEDKIRGMTLAGALCNEVTLMPQSFFRQTLARMSAPGAKLFGSTNPDSPYHWLKTDFLDREDELDLRQWRFELDDNIFLDDDYVQSLKAEYTGMWYSRFIEGQWVLAAGAVYQNFDAATHVRPLPGDRDPEAYIVDVDYGTSNPTTFSLKGIWHEEAEDGQTRPFAHVLSEHYHDGRADGQKTDAEHAQDLVDWLPERVGDQSIDPTVYLDPSAASFMAELRSRGLDVRPADNDVLDGIRFVSSMLSRRAARDGLPGLTFDPSCTESPKEYSSYVWDEKAQKRGEDKPLKERDHCPDRDRYGLFTHLHDPDTHPAAFGSILSAN